MWTKRAEVGRVGNYFRCHGQERALFGNESELILDKELHGDLGEMPHQQQEELGSWPSLRMKFSSFCKKVVCLERYHQKGHGGNSSWCYRQEFAL